MITFTKVVYYMLLLQLSLHGFELVCVERHSPLSKVPKNIYLFFC